MKNLIPAISALAAKGFIFIDPNQKNPKQLDGSNLPELKKAINKQSLIK